MVDHLSSLNGSTVVISGASRGIGLAIAFAAAGNAADHRHIDDDVLTDAGHYDLARYGGGAHPILDLFIG